MANLVDAGGILKDLFAGRSALMLEDQREFGEPVRNALLDAGFGDVVLVTTGEEALALGSCRRFDILILDRNNPGLEGLEVLRRIRALDAAGKTSATSPALILSMLGDPGDRLEGLLAGANDYIPKRVEEPEREVVLRVAAQLKGSQSVPAQSERLSGDWIQFGGFRMNINARMLEFENRTIDLGGGKLPLGIMRALLQAKGVPMTHTMLWDSCWTDWKFRPDTYVNIVDTRIKRLRQIIAEQMPEGLRDRHSVIANVWLEGFVIRDLSGRAR